VIKAAPALAGSAPWPVPYGIDKMPAGAASLDRFPRLLLHPGKALRLNDEAFELPPPAIGQEAVSTDIRLTDHLKRLSGTWNRPATLFIDNYFDHLRQVVAAHRAAIEQHLAPMAGLFAPEDVLYSAPLPLPRALPPLPDGESLMVDMLFWLGGRAEAVLFAPSPLLPAAERRRRERLAAAGIGVTVLTAGELAGPGVFAALLGEQGRAFWRDELLPSAPGGPRLPPF
jgi:hypothetical protein